MSKSIIINEFMKFILIPKILFEKNTAKGTIAIDKPKLRAIRSILSNSFLEKNTYDQTNPGKNNTKTEPNIICIIVTNIFFNYYLCF